MPNLSFNAIDVETANSDHGSVCQIGVATVRDGAMTGQESMLIDPEQPFAEFNVRLHGIDAEKVRGQRTLPEVYPELRESLEGAPLISHTFFDKNAMRRAADRYGLPPLNATWLDSAAIARAAWPRFRRRGYNLASLANEFGIEFRHHDAGEDARAAAEVVLQACECAGVDINGWRRRFGVSG